MLYKRIKKKKKRFLKNFLFGMDCITKINKKLKNIYHFGTKINHKRESGHKTIIKKKVLIVYDHALI